MYNKRYNEAIDTLIKHIKISNFIEEKSSSMRFIAICYKELNRLEEALMYLKKSIEITPDLRESYVLLGTLYYEMKDYSLSIEYLEKASKITNKTLTYINEEYAWNETIYDILSLNYFYIGNLTKSLENIDIALKINPLNKRILKNKEIIKSLI